MSWLDRPPTRPGDVVDVVDRATGATHQYVVRSFELTREGVAVHDLVSVDWVLEQVLEDLRAAAPGD